MLKIKRADTFLSRLRGLLFYRVFPTQYDGLLLASCNSIHTCFMRFAIDAIFMDTTHRIIHIVRNLAPWRLPPRIHAASSVLEFPSGFATQHQLNIDDYCIHLRRERTRKTDIYMLVRQPGQPLLCGKLSPMVENLMSE